MVRRHIGLVALLLVVLYAAAVVHQVLPHDHAHGDGSSCALCVLLAGLVLAFGVFVLLRDAPRGVPGFCLAARFPHRPSWRLPFVRGPPVSPF